MLHFGLLHSLSNHGFLPEPSLFGGLQLVALHGHLAKAIVKFLAKSRAWVCREGWSKHN